MQHPPRLLDRAPLEDLLVGARFLRRLPEFFRQPLRPDEALAIVRGRLERREADFIAMAQRLIYDHPTSPYRQLLALAGCESGDLERLVQTEGVDGALSILARQGVYLSVEELKGRRPAVRGSARIAIQPRQLYNPRSRYHLTSRTSGSRGSPAPVLIDLAFLRERAADACLALAARGGNEWRKAVWDIPGGAISAVLRASSFGAPIERWFTLVRATEPGLDPRYRRAERLLRWGARLGGIRLPRTEYAPVDDPLPVARWMAEVLRQGGVPYLRTFVSPMVRACQAAAAAGLDLTGAQVTPVGEPITAARLAAIRASGMVPVPSYSSIESGEMAHGCLAPQAPDACHVFRDFVALVQVDAAPPTHPLPSGALLVTGLRPTMPIVLFNVSLGDRAVLTSRRCGCPLEAVGWTTQVHTIRSFEKLTAAGMTFLDLDLVRVLEEVLPGRFGGGPTHYQLVEAEDEAGRPSLRLLVDPTLGPLDESVIAEAFLSAISAGSDIARIMGQVWRGAQVLRVERQPPIALANGKIHHLHQVRLADRQASHEHPAVNHGADDSAQR